MATKKKGLGRGMDSLIPEKTVPAAEKERELTDEEIAGQAVGEVAMILSRNISAIDTYIAERMIRMIISLCKSELRNGWIEAGRD